MLSTIFFTIIFNIQQHIIDLLCFFSFKKPMNFFHISKNDLGRGFFFNLKKVNVGKKKLGKYSVSLTI